MGNGVMSRNRSREVVVSAEGLEQTRPGCKRKDRMEGGGEMATDEDEEVIPPLAENDLEGGIPALGLEELGKTDPRTRLPPIEETKVQPSTKVADGNQYRGAKERIVSDQLHDLLERLSSGDIPPVEDLHKTISAAAKALRNVTGPSITCSEECLEAVNDVEVREWLSKTFTHSDSVSEMQREKPRTPLLMFKAAANSIIISNFLMNFSTCSSTELTMPAGVKDYCERHMNAWDFDIFHVKSLSDRAPLRSVSYQLFKAHNLFKKFQIPPNTFDLFMSKIEEDYGHYDNPYHNSCHGADVAQTLHYLILNSGLLELVSDLEILAMLLAAIVHDVDHPGRSSQFLVLQRSEWALLYHDKSVLENHHLKVTFDYLQEESTNFLVNLSVEDYRSLRGLVIDMVLATDMAHHFTMVKTLASQVASPEGGAQLLDKDRHKVFDSLLHLADISHPGKPWRLHHEWSTRICEEFYRQGDEEKELGCPVSPLCDRSNNNLPTSQIKFAEIIVSPFFQVGGDMIELLLATAKEQGILVEVLPCTRVWDRCLHDNKNKWEERHRREEAFRCPIVPSKKVNTGMNRKISLNLMPNSQAGEMRRKASVDGILLTSRGRTMLNRYYQSSHLPPSVPKIMLEHVPDSTDQDNSRGSTPASSASAYDSCSDGTDPNPETPNSLRESSDFSSSSPDSPLNPAEEDDMSESTEQKQSTSTFKLPNVIPSSSKPSASASTFASSTNSRPISGRRKSSKDKLLPTPARSLARGSSSPSHTFMSAGGSASMGRKRRTGMLQSTGN